MFSADLSWTDPDTEKVGERRERLARERQREGMSPETVDSGRTSRTSIQNDREIWWPSSLKKAKSKKPTSKSGADNNHSKLRGRAGSLQPIEIGPITLSKPHEIGTSDTVRDPAKQPSGVLSGTLSQPLPSGAPLDPPGNEIPELEGDFSSRRTDSTGSRSSRERRWGWRTPGKIKVVNEVHEIQQLSPQSYVSRTTRLSSEEAVPQVRGPSPVLEHKREKRKPYTVEIEGCLDLAKLQIGDSETSIPQEPDEFNLPEVKQRASYASGLPDEDLVAWRPPSEWDIVLPKSPGNDEGKELVPLPPIPVQTDRHAVQEAPGELTRFQRFIRRMESAGPKIILDRLKEEWSNPVDEKMCDEMELEKQLWVLTAYQLRNLGRYSRFPNADTKNILELYGNMSEVYQLSAMYSGKRIHYLTTKPPKSTPVPENVSSLLMSQAGAFPLPYPDGYFSHIRASTLPSLVPSSQLPAMFHECYRLLAPGGMLEIRIMDAAPTRWTAGPKMKAWIEDRLSMNLERLFRCSKPCTLVPGWVADAGFKLPSSSPSPGDENIKLRCASESNTSDVDTELSTLVGRALWKDIWGEFVDDIPGEPRWWWEDDEVLKECLERQTVFECGSIFAFKG